MSTTMHRGSIGKWMITISGLGHRPLILMSIWTPQNNGQDEWTRAQCLPLSSNPKEREVSSLPGAQDGQKCHHNCHAKWVCCQACQKEAVIKRETGLAPEALLFAKKGCRGSNAGKGSKSPKRDRRNTQGDIDGKEKDLWKCFRCQCWGDITQNCLSKQRGDPVKAADTAPKALTETISTLSTLIKHYQIVASSNVSSSDWFIDCGCTTPIFGDRSIFITNTVHSPNSKQLKEYNVVKSFTSGYGSVRLIRQLPDGKLETIILQEVVHLPGSLNLISQYHIMDKDIIVKPVTHHSSNLYNHNGKSIATAPQVNGLFVLHRVLHRAPQSTVQTDIDDDSCLQALTATGHASWHDAEKWMLRHCRLVYIGLKDFEILQTITDDPGMTGMCDCESYIKCKLSRRLCPLNTPGRATDSLHLPHSDIYGQRKTAKREGWYMLLFMHDATRHTDEYTL